MAAKADKMPTPLAVFLRFFSTELSKVLRMDKNSPEELDISFVDFRAFAGIVFDYWDQKFYERGGEK